MKKIVKITFALSFFIFIFLTIFQYSALDIDYFIKKIEENNTEEITQIEKDELIKISEIIIEYLEGDRDNLIIYYENNPDKLVFEDRELIHMEDVKVLFNNGFVIKNMFLLLFLMSILILKIFFKEKISKTLIIGGIITISILILLGIAISLNFNKLFIIFHEVLFTNDLWLLDPKEDVLIQMLPTNFFYDLGLIIIKRYILAVLIIVVISAVMYKNKLFKNI